MESKLVPIPAKAGTLSKRTQAEIARTNGRKSHGPITSAGKAISSQNAIRHGLRAEHVVVTPLENPKDWEAHMDATLDALEPRDYIEALIAERVAVSSWKLRRVARAHAAIATAQLESAADDAAQACAEEQEREALQAIVGRGRYGAPGHDPNTSVKREAKRLRARRLLVDDIEQAELLDRYESTAERGFYKALSELRAMRSTI
jgi:hypothetical protein